MARVTVEDCLKKIPNHFELILIAGYRAKEILNGKEPKISRKNSTISVLVLREIAENAIDIEEEKENFMYSFGAANGFPSRANSASEAPPEENVIVEDEAKDLLIIEDAESDPLLATK